MGGRGAHVLAHLWSTGAGPRSNAALKRYPLNTPATPALPPHCAGREARARRNSLGSLRTGQHLTDTSVDKSGDDLNKLLLEGLKNRSARRGSLAWPPAASMTTSIAGVPPQGSAEADAEAVKGFAMQLAALSSQRSSVASVSGPAPNQRMHSPSKEPSHTSPQSRSYGHRSLSPTGNDVVTCRRERAASSAGRPATSNRSPTTDDRLPPEAQLAAHADSRMPDSGQGAGARSRARRPPARQGSNLAQVMSAARAAVEGTNAIASAQPLSSQQQLQQQLLQHQASMQRRQPAARRAAADWAVREAEGDAWPVQPPRSGEQAGEEGVDDQPPSSRTAAASTGASGPSPSSSLAATSAAGPLAGALASFPAGASAAATPAASAGRTGLNTSAGSEPQPSQAKLSPPQLPPRAVAVPVNRLSIAASAVLRRAKAGAEPGPAPGSLASAGSLHLPNASHGRRSVEVLSGSACQVPAGGLGALGARTSLDHSQGRELQGGLEPWVSGAGLAGHFGDSVGQSGTPAALLPPKGSGPASERRATARSSHEHSGPFFKRSATDEATPSAPAAAAAVACGLQPTHSSGVASSGKLVLQLPSGSTHTRRPSGVSCTATSEPQQAQPVSLRAMFDSFKTPLSSAEVPGRSRVAARSPSGAANCVDDKGRAGAREVESAANGPKG